MDDQSLINLLLAVLVAVGLHELGEPWNLMNKLKRINDAIHGTETARKPTFFNTTPRALTGSAVFLIGASGGAYLIIGLMDPSLITALWVAIVGLVVIEMVSSWQVDKFHRAAADTISNIPKK